jgi:hypothetical protein
MVIPCTSAVDAGASGTTDVADTCGAGVRDVAEGVAMVVVVVVVVVAVGGGLGF